MTTGFNTLQNIKRRFFAMRNGIIADTMRKAGDTHRIIFGLNLPQLAEIAHDYLGDRSLACTLWDNRTTRESRLIAPMIFPASEMPRELSMQWALDAQGFEETDILCHRLLRRLPYATDLLDSLIGIRGCCYLTLRLALNLLPDSAPQARELIESADENTTHAEAILKRRIMEELMFIEQ